LQRQPFARDRFKRVRRSQLLSLPLTAGINAGGELPTRRIAALARLFQRCVGMRTQGEAVLQYRSTWGMDLPWSDDAPTYAPTMVGVSSR